MFLDSIELGQQLKPVIVMRNQFRLIYFVHILLCIFFFPFLILDFEVELTDQL